MTIRLTIKNEDSRENAIIGVIGVHKTTITLEPVYDPAKELKGGESCEVYVHDGKEIHIKEVKNG